MEIKFEQKKFTLEEKEDEEEFKVIPLGLGRKKLESSPFSDIKIKKEEVEVSPMKEDIPKVKCDDLPKDL